MTTLVLFLCSMSAACLQLLSRNLFYILVAAMGIITVLVMEYCKEKELHWGWQVPSHIGNLFLLGNAIGMHCKFGHIINDYLIISVMLTLFIVLTVVEMLPQKRKPSRKGRFSAFKGTTDILNQHLPFPYVRRSNS